jgi:hypothetical protein
VSASMLLYSPAIARSALFLRGSERLDSLLR